MNRIRVTDPQRFASSSRREGCYSQRQLRITFLFVLKHRSSRSSQTILANYPAPAGNQHLIVGHDQINPGRPSALWTIRSGHVTAAFVFEILTVCAILGGILTGLPAILNLGIIEANSTTDSGKLPILNLAVTSNGRKLWVQPNYSEIISIDLNTNRVEPVFSNEFPRIGTWNISHDGRTFLVSNLEREVRIYRDGELIVSESVPPDKSVATLLSRGGKMAMRISGGRDVQCWDLSTTEPVDSGFVLSDVGYKFALDSNGLKLAASTSGYTERILRIYDVKTGQMETSIPGNDGSTRDIVFSGDGCLVAIVSQRSMTLCDVYSGETLWTVKAAEKAAFHGAAFSPEDEWVAVTGIDSGILIIDRMTGKCCSSISAKSKTIKVGFSHENNTFYTGDAEGTIWASCLSSQESETKRISLKN